MTATDGSGPRSPRGGTGGVFARLSRLPIRRMMQFLLLGQVAIAGALVGTDITDHRPFRDERIDPVAVPAVAPGDQLRPYAPGTVPRHPDAAPGTGEGTGLPEMTGTLRLERVDHPEFGPALLLAGAIGNGDSDRLETALDGEGPIRTVMLHSPGGRLAEALRMGQIVRDRGLDTAVTAEAACNSACPYILFGGVERTVSRRAWIGLHQASLEAGTLIPTARALADVQRLQGEALDHVARMGVDPLLEVHALATPPEQAYFLVEEELLRYRVATRVID